MNQIRPPDCVLFSEAPFQIAQGTACGEAWSYRGAEVVCSVENGLLGVDVRSPECSLHRIVLRWQISFAASARFLGDHWERGYGDLEWRALVSERVMPWYFLSHVDGRTQGWGVRTGAKALCFWTVDAQGFSLWLDLRNGTEGVHLGERTLRAAEIVTGEWSESPYAAARALCRLMCPSPLLPVAPVYGGNDWYYAYGRSTRETAVRDAAFLSKLAGGVENRPFSVIDGGWQTCGEACGAPWFPNARFKDMAALAADIRNTGARPGLWMRPLLTHEDSPAEWTLTNRGVMPSHGRILDPSNPEVLGKIGADIRRLKGWGYDLLKHDFSTYDLFAKWGFEMGAAVTSGSWSFGDRTCTSAEIIRALYHAIREAAGDTVVIGCNTIGHLSAGLFELQRTGDDTSGRDWERTRRMGVNTLAFRMPQHGTFFSGDADCVGLTNQVPWELNRQWLSLLAESGTPLFVSADPEAIGVEQMAALRDAFSIASSPQELAEPLDWMETTCPAHWRIGGTVKSFAWNGPEGVSPFIMA